MYDTMKCIVEYEGMCEHRHQSAERFVLLQALARELHAQPLSFAVFCTLGRFSGGLVRHLLRGGRFHDRLALPPIGNASRPARTSTSLVWTGSTSHLAT